MSETPVIDVKIGEVRIARRGETLKAILGSCVGIAILWPERKLAGLAHCLLPRSPSPTFTIGARFVDQALRSLMAMMKIQPADYPQIKVVIVGGGNMTGASEDRRQLVGAANHQVAVTLARELGLPITHYDGGGNVGRRIVVDGTHLSFEVAEIPRLGPAESESA